MSLIIPRERVPRGEEHIYVDYLPDREIGRYTLPTRTEKVVFFPYAGDNALQEGDLSNKFPKTWQYLMSNRKTLAARSGVRSHSVPWWRPLWSREPAAILRPKIVCPHLMLTPRFAIDITGNLAVSRSPFLIASDTGEEKTLLRFFCAVLNSSVCNWYLRTYAPKYGRGYNRLEVSTLRSIPVPDLSKIDFATLGTIVEMVDALSAASRPRSSQRPSYRPTRQSEQSLDSQLDAMIADLYGISSNERKTLLGIE